VGFEFTLNQNIDLTQLGFFAEALGGDTPHVALLDITAGQTNPPNVLYDTGNILSDITTDYASGFSPDGSPLVFNYVSVGTPIELFTGHTYELSAPLYWTQYFSGTGGNNDDSGFTIDSVIQSAAFEVVPGWNGWDLTNGVSSQAYNYTSQATTGTYTAGTGATGTAYLSANFQYTPVVVPEPQTWGLIIGGMGALSWYRSIRRRAR
jgi:hypothetical protein